jgi:ATP-dependent Clp protease ATP-binding subunit ClpB
VLKEVSDSNGKIVLFIDEIHTVVGAGATGGAMDAGEAAGPAHTDACSIVGVDFTTTE